MSTPQAPVRVDLMIGGLGMGGTEKQLVLLARGLRRRGVQTRVLVLFGGGPNEQVLRETGIPVIPLGFATRTRAGWRMPLVNAVAFARLVRHLRRSRPDILHAFLFHGYVPGAAAARLARVPVFVAGRRNLGEISDGHRLLRALEGAATRAADLVIANAQAVAHTTQQREHVPARKVAVIYNGLPGSAFESAPPAAITTPWPVVLCVANLRPVKGHRFLLDAIARLRNEGLRTTLLLAGDGTQRAILQDQAHRLGIDAQFLGVRTDVPALLARADAVVLPSVREGMSNAVMEAMAAGRPVVATAVGGTPELLGGDRGILVPPKDAHALATALRRVLTGTDLADQLAAQAQAWARTHLSADVMVERHIHLYTQLRRSQRGDRRPSGPAVPRTRLGEPKSISG